MSVCFWMYVCYCKSTNNVCRVNGCGEEVGVKNRDQRCLGDFKWAHGSFVEINTHTTDMGWPHVVLERVQTCPLWVINQCKMKSLNNSHWLSITSSFWTLYCRKHLSESIMSSWFPDNSEQSLPLDHEFFRFKLEIYFVTKILVRTRSNTAWDIEMEGDTSQQASTEAHTPKSKHIPSLWTSEVVFKVLPWWVCPICPLQTHRCPPRGTG